MSEPSLQQIADAYVKTRITTLKANMMSVDIKTEISRWSLFHKEDGSDWFVVQLSHSVHPTSSNPYLGLWYIRLKLKLLLPDGTTMADVFKYAPTATQPGVSHSDGVSFSLDGELGVSGLLTGGLASAGVSFDNSYAVSYPGILVEDQTAGGTIELTWKVAIPEPTPVITRETMSFECTAVFRVADGLKLGATPSYQMNMVYGMGGWLTMFGSNGNVDEVTGDPVTIATPAAPRI